jgi:hypothetical protein
MSDFLGSYQSLFLSILFWVVLLFLTVVFFRIFRQVWLFYKQSLYKKAVDWIILELKIPRDVLQTPRVMEQFFINLYGLRNSPGDLLEKYIEGEVTLWWSLEIASFDSKVHFYIRTPKKHKKMVEAGLYAQYPNVEVMEVPDYLNRFPSDTKEIYESNENIFGSEFFLDKENFYPIKTYERFELSKEEMALDPMSALIEVLANLHREENVFIQILVAPADDEWKEEGDEFIKKQTAKGKKKKGGLNDILYQWIKNLFWAPAQYPIWLDSKEGGKEEKFSLFQLTPGEQDTIKAVEDKLSRHGFECMIRFIYIAPNSIFNTNFARKGLIGAFNQYASKSLNFFRNNRLIETRSRWIYYPYVFVPKRVEARKQRIWYNFRNRLFPEKMAFGKFFTSHIFNFNNKSKTYILVDSELATLFHIPGERVLTSPHIERAESRRMGPPAGLPIFKEE